MSTFLCVILVIVGSLGFFFKTLRCGSYIYESIFRFWILVTERNEISVLGLKILIWILVKETHPIATKTRNVFSRMFYILRLKQY